MKATGIVRRIDDLGRIVIPMELRRTFGIGEGESIEISTGNQGEIILMKYVPPMSCIVCGTVNQTCKSIDGKCICKNCIKKIKDYDI